MGLDPADARSGLRFSLGRTTSEADVDHALGVLVDAVKRLRAT
jgi:cysteine desulfurase